MGREDVTAAEAAPAVALLGIAGLAGGALHALKGLVLLLGGPDLSFVPAMTILFGAGLLGLAARVAAGGRRDALVAAGAGLAGVAVVAGVAGVAYQAAGIAPEQPGSPAGVKAAYAAGMLAILLGLLLLGLAAQQARTFAGRWRSVPLVVALVWFPLEALTAFAPDGVGLLAAGLAWTSIGVAVLRAPAAAAVAD